MIALLWWLYYLLTHGSNDGSVNAINTIVFTLTLWMFDFSSFDFHFLDHSIWLVDHSMQWMHYHASRSWSLMLWTRFYTLTFLTPKFSTSTFPIFDFSIFDFNFLLQWSFNSTGGSFNGMNALPRRQRLEC